MLATATWLTLGGQTRLTTSQVTECGGPQLALRDQILVLLASSVGAVQVTGLQRWTEAKNLAHFRNTLRGLHKARLIELSQAKMEVQLLPPGSKEASLPVAHHIA